MFAFCPVRRRIIVHLRCVLVGLSVWVWPSADVRGTEPPDDSRARELRRLRPRDANQDVEGGGEAAGGCDYELFADSYADNCVRIRFTFASDPVSVVFSRSPGTCGTVSPTLGNPTYDSSCGCYLVSTKYCPCETEGQTVTVTADPSFGANRTKTVCLLPRIRIPAFGADDPCVATFDARTGLPAAANVTVSVIPPSAGSVNPTSGRSARDPATGLYIFCTQYTAGSLRGRVRVRFVVDNPAPYEDSLVIYSYDQGCLQATPPAPSVSSNNCGPKSLMRVGSPPAGVTWYWQGTSCGTRTDRDSGSAFFPHYSATTSGTYYLRARDDACMLWSDCSSVAVTVNVNPAYPSAPAGSPDTCAPATLTRGVAPAGVNWYWQGQACEFRTDLGSAAMSPASSPGTYYIRARNTTSLCWSEGCSSVAIGERPPNPEGVGASPANICQGWETSLSATAGGAVIEWYWDDCSGTPIDEGWEVPISPSSTATFYARARSVPGCWSEECVPTTVSVAYPCLDDDADVDLRDFSILQSCYCGEACTDLAGCEAADVITDGVVNASDWFPLAFGLTGPLEAP